MWAIGLSNRWMRGATLLGVAAWALACGEQSTQPTIDGFAIRTAQEGGGSRPKVNDTDPPGAPQATQLVVKVFGSGFDQTSKVEFLLNRKSTNDITTNSTTPINENEVLADITIAPDAAVDLFDVKVTAAGGRKRGIGIELFEVTVNPGGTGRAEAIVTITGGLIAAGEVNLSENSNRLHFNAGAFEFQHIDLKIDMTATTKGKDDLGINACKMGGDTVNQPGLAALFAKLTDGVMRERKLFVRIDKNSLDPSPSPSSDNEISVTWMEESDEGPLGPFDLSIRFAKGLNPDAGSPTVTLAEGNDINDDEFTVTFTGGSVRLRDRTGKPRDKLLLACPNLDGVTITLRKS